jgi:thiamine-monophosphate kinase
MFTQQTKDSIRALGEVELIRQLRSWLGEVAPASPHGMGDDCAVVDLPEGQTQLLTTDSLSYGQHFDDQVTAKDAGAKLVKRNLSDLAAMGGRPGQALLTLLCGGDLNINWLEAFIAGIRETCEIYDLPLVGGDISALAAGQFSSVLSLTGYIEHPPLLRSGAQTGDHLYVTGSLGGSLRGKHYRFAPLLKQGQWLAQCGLCSAMMDLTDGLGKDLRQLIPTGCAAQLELDRIPVSPDAALCAAESGRSTLEHAFCDGEDYELLFVIKSGSDLTAFEQSWQANFPETPLSRIGHFSESTCDAPYLDAQTKEALPWQKGFEHLSGQ